MSDNGERIMTNEQYPVDLNTLWEAHCRHEFAERDVDATMKTMVPEPYVNHIPTMTGGVGMASHCKIWLRAEALVELDCSHCRLTWVLPRVQIAVPLVEFPAVGLRHLSDDLTNARRAFLG